MTSTDDTQCCEACPEAPRGAEAPRSPGGLRLRKRPAFSVSTENDTLPLAPSSSAWADLKVAIPLIAPRV